MTLWTLALCGLLVGHADAAKKRAASARRPAIVAKSAILAKSAAAAETAAPASSPDSRMLLAEIGRGADGKRFKAYLKRRQSKIKDDHKTRKDFFDKEADLLNSFWEKLHDERELFEARITHQMEGLLESLSSLDPGQRALSLSDIERTHSNMVKTFETQDKQRRATFFAAREQRWSEFAVQQEHDRGKFVSQALYDWQATAPLVPGEKKEKPAE